MEYTSKRLVNDDVVMTSRPYSHTDLVYLARNSLYPRNEHVVFDVIVVSVDVVPKDCLDPLSFHVQTMSHSQPLVA